MHIGILVNIHGLEVKMNGFFFFLLDFANNIFLHFWKFMQFAYDIFLSMVNRDNKDP